MNCITLDQITNLEYTVRHMHERVYIGSNKAYEVDLEIDNASADLFIECAQTSAIPKDFYLVHEYARKQRKTLNYRSHIYDVFVHTSLHQELAEQILQLKYPTEFEALYALTYGDTVGSAKWIPIARSAYQSAVEQMNTAPQQYTAALSAACDRYHIQPTYLMQSLLDGNTQISDAEQKELVRLHDAIFATRAAHLQADIIQKTKYDVFLDRYKELLKLRLVAANKFSSFGNTLSFFFFTMGHPIPLTEELAKLERDVEDQVKRRLGPITILARQASKPAKF